jgi:hypothetical protein
MNLADAFHMGGWGMWPTLICGVLLIGAAVWYAVQPARRLGPLLVSLGLMTFISGLLGLSMGVIKSLLPMGQLAPDARFIPLIGIAESMYNIVWAFCLIMIAAVIGAVGAWRLARQLPELAPGEA